MNNFFVGNRLKRSRCNWDTEFEFFCSFLNEDFKVCVQIIDMH